MQSIESELKLSFIPTCSMASISCPVPCTTLGAWVVERMVLLGVIVCVHDDRQLLANSEIYSPCLS